MLPGCASLTARGENGPGGRPGGGPPLLRLLPESPRSPRGPGSRATAGPGHAHAPPESPQSQVIHLQRGTKGRRLLATQEQVGQVRAIPGHATCTASPGLLCPLVSAGVRRAPSSAGSACCWRVGGTLSRMPSTRTAVFPRLLFTSIWIRTLLLPVWASGLCPRTSGWGHQHLQWLHEAPSHQASIQTALHLGATGKCVQPKHEACDPRQRLAPVPALSALMGPGAGLREDSDTWEGEQRTEPAQGLGSG